MNFSKVQPPDLNLYLNPPSRPCSNPPSGWRGQEEEQEIQWISDKLVALMETVWYAACLLIGSADRAFNPNWWPKKRGPKDLYGVMPYPYDVRPRSGHHTDYLAKASLVDDRAAAAADRRQYGNNVRRQAWEES